MGGFKRLLSNTALVLCSVSVTAAVIEFVFISFEPQYKVWQSRGPFRLHEQRIYSLRPSFTRTWKSTEFTEALSSNRDGLRGPELRQGPRTWSRILVLGDSFTYGHGVSNDESYPARLAEFFDQGGSDVEVVNAGVPGYGTDQQHVYFTQELHLLEPDVLVLNLNLNDRNDNIALPLYTIADGKLVRLQASKTSLYFLANLHTAAPEWLRSSHLFNYLLLRMSGQDLFHQLPDLDRRELMSWSEQKIKLALIDLKRFSRERGSCFVVVTMPLRGRPSAYGFIIPFLQKEEIPTLDLSIDAVWEPEKSALWYEVDRHPTAKGYAQIAESVHRFLNSACE